MNQPIRLQKDTLSTAAIEQRIEQAKQDIVRYRRVEQSAELQEFMALREVVEAPAFQENKQVLLHRKYKHTEEYKTLARYRRLRRTLGVMLYNWAVSHERFAEYVAFTKTERYALLQDKEAVRADKELHEFYLLDRSLSARVYRRYVKTDNVQDSLRLQEETQSEEFQTRNTFWANPRRWYTTEDSLTDGRYLELKQLPDIQFFLATDPKQIAEWESYKLLFEDAFAWQQLGDSAWAAGFYYSNPNLKTDHSYFNEQQANNQGLNVSTAGGILAVEVRKESRTATAWHPTKGFIPKEYAWTGDVVQTGARFGAAEGVFIAKVRVSGKASAAVYLASGERLPLLRMMQWDGKSLTAGLRTAQGAEGVTIEGVRAGQWWLYTVQVTKKEIVWYVNNQEVMRAANTLGGASLYPAVATFLPEGTPAGAGKVEVDWVRIYNKE